MLLLFVACQKEDRSIETPDPNQQETPYVPSCIPCTDTGAYIPIGPNYYWTYQYTRQSYAYQPDSNGNYPIITHTRIDSVKYIDTVTINSLVYFNVRGLGYIRFKGGSYYKWVPSRRLIVRFMIEHLSLVFIKPIKRFFPRYRGSYNKFVLTIPE